MLPDLPEPVTEHLVGHSNMHTILLSLCDYYRDQYRVLTQSVSLSLQLQAFLEL